MTYVGFNDPQSDLYGSNAYDFTTDYDAMSGEVFVETTSSFSSYHPVNDTWTMHIDLYNELGGRWGERTGVIAETQRLFLSIGLGEVMVYDLANLGSYELWTTTGPQDVVDGDAVGLAYDPISEAVVGWAGGQLHVLDVENRSWTTVAGQTPADGNDTWGRFAYVPCEDAFIAIPGFNDANVWLYKK